MTAESNDDSIFEAMVGGLIRPGGHHLRLAAMPEWYVCLRCASIFKGILDGEELPCEPDWALENEYFSRYPQNVLSFGDIIEYNISIDDAIDNDYEDYYEDS